ncbi:GreA/GreB family elongation factor [uncultured Sphingomonas sp.]|uniref:GreA/GreB family elongation factor n=1 Tax=uncultured Sphingomonas sp. TaxID=158754 RepID=UPI0035CA2CC5
MSVAFRRESDDEHKEPTFEIPIAPGPNLVTARGLTLIEAKIAELEAAAAHGDEASRPALLRDLRYWRTRRATAEVAPPPPPDGIGIGSRVTIRLDGRQRSVTIVGGDEADPPAGLVGFQAPLARALIGAGVGDRADFAGRADAIEIMAIEQA